MTDLREAAQMALGALIYNYTVESRDETIEALRAALAAKEPEPVAIVTGTHGGYFVVTPTNRAMVLPVHMALYAAPPQREWQGLTEDEMFSLWVKCPAETEERFAFARIIEARLKEKNT